MLITRASGSLVFLASLSHWRLMPAAHSLCAMPPACPFGVFAMSITAGEGATIGPRCKNEWLARLHCRDSAVRGTMKSMPGLSSYALVFFCIATSVLTQAQTRQTENIIFVMTDGLRWQEVFHGADPTLLNLEHGRVKDVDALKKAYWRDSVTDRRSALMPFLWTVAAGQGQIYGNLSKGSDAHVTNTLNFIPRLSRDVLRLRRSSRE